MVVGDYSAHHTWLLYPGQPQCHSKRHTRITPLNRYTVPMNWALLLLPSLPGCEAEGSHHRQLLWAAFCPVWYPHSPIAPDYLLLVSLNSTQTFVNSQVLNSSQLPGICAPCHETSLVGLLLGYRVCGCPGLARPMRMPSTVHYLTVTLSHCHHHHSSSSRCHCSVREDPWASAASSGAVKVTTHGRLISESEFGIYQAGASPHCAGSLTVAPAHTACSGQQPGNEFGFFLFLFLPCAFRSAAKFCSQRLLNDWESRLLLPLRGHHLVLARTK